MTTTTMTNVADVGADAVPPPVKEGPPSVCVPGVLDAMILALDQFGTLTWWTAALESDRDGFFEQFTTQFFSVDGTLRVSEDRRQEALAMCRQADRKAVLGCVEAFATTDFRDDLAKVTVPTLVLHGDGDAVVPFEGSGARTHRAIQHSRLVLVPGAPHGLNVSHVTEFDQALLQFLAD